MRKTITAAAVVLSAFGVAHAGIVPVDVPEMDAGVGIAALALLGGGIAVLRERARRR